MAVLTPIPAAAVAPLAAPPVAGPACSLQRSGSLWQLGSEAQELTTAISQLAEQLETEDPEQRASALAELEAALLAEEGNKQALAAKADATCWVIEHLRGQATYRSQQAKRLADLARSDASRAEALSSAAAPVSVLVVALPGGAGTASLVREARRLAAHAPVPLSVAQISHAPSLP